MKIIARISTEVRLSQIWFAYGFLQKCENMFGAFIEYADKVSKWKRHD